MEEEVKNETVVEEPTVEEKPMENKPKKKSKIWLLIVLLVILVAILVGFYFLKTNQDKNKKKEAGKTEVVTPIKDVSEYRITGNSLQNFDLYFLQVENKEENMLYSPLSIKYALEMLGEGAICE